MRKEITDRDDLSLLVHQFYAKVRVDEDLGPIFNSIITDWEEHLEKLTNFWEMTLFGKRVYDGNPITAHQNADDFTGNKIASFHFGIWLNYWFATIDTYFEGENAEFLKNRARKMQTFLMVSIFEHRKK